MSQPVVSEPRPSCVFLTTPTSATESLWRLLYQSARHGLKPTQEADTTPSMQTLNDAEIGLWKPDPFGHLYIYRRSYVGNINLLDPNLRLVVNVRDTRDIACNQFHWHLQHPPTGGKSEEDVKPYREKVAREGIDKFVLDWRNEFFLTAHRAVEARLHSGDPNVLLVSYNQLCLGFDELVDDLCAFFAVPRSSLPTEIIERERIANLKDNPAWIGQRWAGADLAPGRYLRELQPETIVKLNEKHAGSLDFLRSLEKPQFQHIYDHSTTAPPP